MEKKTMRNVFVVVVVVLLVCIAFVIEFNIIYKKMYDDVQKEAVSVFYKSLSMDMNRRLKEANVFYSFTYDPIGRTDSIEVQDKLNFLYQKRSDSIAYLSLESRQTMSLQSLLFMKSPIKVEVLDSVFQTELKKNGILAETGILYVDQVKNIEYISRNFVSLSLYAYSTGKKELGIQKEILVQGLIDIHPSCVLLKHKAPFIILICVWLAVIALLFGGIYYYKKKMANFMTNLLEGAGLDPGDDSELYTQRQPSILAITQDIILDLDHCTLTYLDEKVFLGDQSTFILKYLLDKEERYASYEEIIDELWGNLADPASRLTQAIKRLRNSLATVTVIEVENVRGKGYCLHIEDLARLDIIDEEL